MTQSKHSYKTHTRKNRDLSEPVGFDDDSCCSDSSDVTDSDINFIENSEIENYFEYSNPFLNPVKFPQPAKRVHLQFQSIARQGRNAEGRKEGI